MALTGTPPTGFSDTLVTSGLVGPLSLAFLPDGSDRMVIIEQAGVIRAWDGATLSMLHAMTGVNTGGERGLLGVAIDPDWPSRPYLYVHYTASPAPLPYVQVARFTLTDAPLAINPATKLILIDDMPDNQSNHNGGTLRFGPDKTLYISVGDDATAFGCTAQDLTVLAGKILRIRVDDTIDPANRATLAPPDNPFANSPNDNAKLVWAYGLRNPFRFHIHPYTGRVFIGDVGQNTWEEVSVANRSGENFGWPYWEGQVRYRLTLCPTDASLPSTTGPIYVYPNPGGASVIGAAVYVGRSFPTDDSFPPAYDDDFFFTDYYAGFLRVLRENADGTFGLVAGVTPTNWGSGYAFVADFVEGPDGDLWFATGGGQLRRIAFTAAVSGRPTALQADFINSADLRLTWATPAPETNVDHYEVYRAYVYRPDRAGYAKVSGDATLPPGSTSWIDPGAGVMPGASFYFVQAVGTSGFGSPTSGQVGKFARMLGLGPALVSPWLVTSSNLVGGWFRGSIAWSHARTFLAADAADPWKGHDPSRPWNEFTTVEPTGAVWLEVTTPGEFVVAGRVPCTTSVPLVPGWNLVGVPSMTSPAVSSAGLLGAFRVEGYSSQPPYYLRRLGPSETFNPTEGYWIYSAVGQTWWVVNDPNPSCA